MDVAAWLQGLGLERYAPAFRDNDIDWEALPKLSAEDLKDLGVVLGSHRRRLLDAIAALGAAVPAASATAAPRDAPAPAEAERRQLTVMFCDLVGSTALSTRHDPEDLRELIGDYHRVVTETVGHFDGFVAKYMGDGVLIYFGYPRAHEDDAERTVRAGLAVIEAVGQLPAREDLRLRLGIATGLAVVGDLIGEGAAQERGVVGETPNLAEGWRRSPCRTRWLLAKRPTSSRTPAHGSGATWIATPSPQWTFTTYSLPVSRRTHSRCGPHTRAVTKS